MAEPLSEGAVKLTNAPFTPAVATTSVGASGGRGMVTLFDEAETFFVIEPFHFATGHNLLLLLMHESF